eukprot:10531950-Alexandrium_andersonii.AAC.1
MPTRRQLICAGSPTEDRHLWHKELQRYSENKFTNPEETIDVQKQRIQSYRDVAQTHPLAPPPMDVATVLRARARMSQGKVSGDDSIVAEMLKELPLIAVYPITHVFAQRYHDQSSTPIQSWATIIL